MRSTLSTLPVDHLEAILSFITGSSISRLVLCGDRILCSHLYVAVTRLNVVLCSYSDIKFPRIFSLFPRLHTVSIGLFAPTALVAVPGVDLSILPRGLQRLTLDIQNGFCACLTTSPPAALGADIPPEYRAFFIDMNSIFPNLLHFSCKRTAVMPTKLWTRSVANLLPRGLESLHLELDIPFSPDDLACLPRSLTKMAVCWHWKQEEALVGSPPFFPPELVSLELNQLSTGNHHFAYLPQTLTELKHRHPPESTPAADFGKLPRRLRTLVVFVLGVSLSDLAELPPELTTLKFKGHHAIPTTHVLHLPRTITKYSNKSSFDRMQLPTDSILRDLPRNLIKAPMSILGGAKEEQWALLPSGIRSLEVRGYLSTNPQFLDFEFPSCLQKVVMYAPEERILKALPKSVTSIFMGDSKALIDPRWLNHLTQLTTLTCKGGVAMVVNGFEGFTPTLTSLELERHMDLTHLHWSLPCLAKLTHLRINPSPPSSNNPKEDTSTSQDGKEESQTTSEQSSLSNHVSMLENDKDRLVIHLPSNLTDLVISGNAGMMKSSDFCKLPRSLSKLYLNSVVIEDDIAEHLIQLPPSITSLYLSPMRANAHETSKPITATAQQLSLLPKSLVRVRVNSCEGGDAFEKHLLQLRPYIDASLMGASLDSDYARKWLRFPSCADI